MQPKRRARLTGLEGTQVTGCAVTKTTWWAEKVRTRVFSYDENGNCVNDGKRLYEWDVQNRLVRVIVPNEGEVRFRYRADGMRVEKQVVGGLTTKYVYDGQTVIGEIRSDGTKRWYVLGAMGYVCRIDEGANGEILARDYFVYDGLGSCRALVSSSGVVVAKYDYDVYGSVRGQDGQRANSFKYVAQIGHPTDEETGSIYMRARYYDPEIGRFVSEDPGQDGSNWYIYCDNNSINSIDIDGKFVYHLIYVFLSGLVCGIITAILHSGTGSFWSNFTRGFIVGAITAAATLFGPWAGALIGGLVAAIDAAMTGGNPVVGFLIGAVGGAVGGALSIEEAIKLGLYTRYVAISLLIGLIEADAIAYAGLF